MDQTPPRAAVAVKKRRGFSEKNERDVKRFAEDIFAADTDVSWKFVAEAINNKFSVGATSARRMLALSSSSGERRKRDRPKMMTSKMVKVWKEAIDIVSARHHHVGFSDVREIVCGFFFFHFMNFFHLKKFFS